MSKFTLKSGLTRAFLVVGAVCLFSIGASFFKSKPTNEAKTVVSVGAMAEEPKAENHTTAHKAAGGHAHSADHIGLIKLMPLAADFAVGGVLHGMNGNSVTPTHVAVQSGDWSATESWGGSVPGEGAIVHIPREISIAVEGNVSDGGHVFLVRVDGSLTFSAGSGVETRLNVDTLFGTSKSSIKIDAAVQSAGTVDVFLSPFDIEAHKTAGASGWSDKVRGYYSDGAPVKGWMTKAVAQGGAGKSDRLDPEARIADDGAGVLGRHVWDPEQLSLGVVTAGEIELLGKAVKPHTVTLRADIVRSVGRNLKVSAFYLPTENTLGWFAGGKVLVTSGAYRGLDNNDLAENAHAYEAIVEVHALEALGNGETRVTFAEDAELKAEIFGPTTYADGAVHNVSLAFLDRNVNLVSAAALNQDGSVSRATSVNNPLPHDGSGKSYYGHVGINGNLTGENSHLVSQRGHFMAMHSDDVIIKNVGFLGLGRTDKSALIDDFKFYGTNFVGSAAGQGQFQSGGAARSQGGGRIYSDVDGDGKYDPKIDTTVSAAPDEIVNMRGRYSLHLHRAGVTKDDGGRELVAAWVENAVVIGAPGWGIVQHDSEAVLIGNVTYNVVGAGFVSETGNEAGVWYNNLAAKNTGFIRGVMDRTIANDINDIARQGTGFWIEGKNLALFDNLATSSDVGFAWEPYGVSNIHSSNYAAARTNDILRHPSLAEVIEAADVKVDDLVDHLDLLALHGTENHNTNLPIRYFSGNTVSTSRRAVEVTTDPDLAAQKFNDAWSIFSDTTAWEVGYGMNFNYTSKYIIDGFDLYLSDWISANNTAHLYNKQRGIKITNGTSDFVLKNINVVGYEPQVDEVHHSTVIGGNQRTFGQADLYSNSLSFYHGTAPDSPNNIYFTGTAELAEKDLFAGFSSSIAFYSLPDGVDADRIRYNPYYNFYGMTVVGQRVKINTGAGANIVEGASYRLGGDAYLSPEDLPENAFFRVLSDRFPNDGFDVFDFADRKHNAGLSFAYSDDVPPKGVEVTLVDTSAETGVAALWREHLDTRENYDWDSAKALPLLFMNDHWVRDHIKLDVRGRQLPSFVLPHVNEGTQLGFHGLRRFDQMSRGFRKDVWSGALLEFDKTDGYGSQRFAYHDQMMDRDGDGEDEITRLVTHNERIVFSRDMINAALQKDGYLTIDGVEFTDAAGSVQPLKFVTLRTIFTDRVDGRGYVKAFLVVLDTEWENGIDAAAQLDWAAIPQPYATTIQKLKSDGIIFAKSFGVYAKGDLVQTVQTPRSGG